MKKVYKIWIGLLFLSNSLAGQIIDSISRNPFPNVDSIMYWHTFEMKSNNQNYLVSGYFQFCSCDYNKFTKEHDYKGNHKILISEGLLDNNKKQGDWIYWENVKRICCDELQMHPDSTVTYSLDMRTKKIDNKATYLFLKNDSIIVIPFYDNQELKYQIECYKDQCQVFVNGKYLVKGFSLDNLDVELDKILNGEYNFDSKVIIEKSSR